MRVDLKLDSEYTEPLAVIYTAEITDEVTEAVKRLKETGSDIITGFTDERAEILSPDDIYRVYSENQKVLAVTEKAAFSPDLTLTSPGWEVMTGTLTSAGRR